MQPVEILNDLFYRAGLFERRNHFVCRSKRPILIDTAYIADFTDTAGVIAQLDVNLAAVELIISTHCHCDHIGGNKRIQDRSGCDIALHKIGKHFIDTRDDWATWWNFFDQQADFFDCTLALNDGDPIAIGPHEFKVIHTPGHAAEGIVLYSRKEKLLISVSDTLWKNNIGRNEPAGRRQRGPLSHAGITRKTGIFRCSDGLSGTRPALKICAKPYQNADNG